MDYQKITDFRNRSPYARKLCITVTELQAGYARVVKTIGPDDLNPLGRAHGACLFSIADTAAGSAAASYGMQAVTLSASYNFLRGGRENDTVTAEAREVKHGKTVSIYDVTLTNQSGALLGTATMTFYSLEKPLKL